MAPTYLTHINAVTPQSEAEGVQVPAEGAVSKKADKDGEGGSHLHGGRGGSLPSLQQNGWPASATPGTGRKEVMDGNKWP